MATLLYNQKPYDADKLLAVAASCPVITIKDIADVATPEEQKVGLRVIEPITTKQVVVTARYGKYFPLFNAEKIWEALNNGQQINVQLVSSVVMKRAKQLTAEEHAEMREAERQTPNQREFNRHHRTKY